MSRVDLAELDFFSPEVQECPFSVYQQLQDEAPVWQMPGTNVFVVTRYNDIREIIRDPARFSSSFSALLNAGSSNEDVNAIYEHCLLYTSPSPRDLSTSRMPSSA